MATEKENTYPFGERLFIGIVKFFDKKKGFGYIASNNYGMGSNPRFKNTEQSFYIDNSSWSTPVPEKKVVIFRPSFSNSKLKANDVRKINIETDRALVLEYYENNNFICYKEKKTKFAYNRHGQRYIEDYDYINKEANILSNSGIARYQLLTEYAEKYNTTNNFKELLSDIDLIIRSIKGEDAYNKQIRSNYGNKEKEQLVWLNIFNLLSTGQIKVLLACHPSLQVYAPDSFLLENIDSIEKKWGMPDNVEKVFRNIEYTKKLREVERLITNSGLKDKTRDEIEEIKSIFEKDLPSNCISVLNERIDDAIISEIKQKISTIDNISINNFLCIASEINDEYNLLTPKGHDIFKANVVNEYEDKIVQIVKSASNLDWDDYRRDDVKKFVCDDIIISSEKLTKPKQAFKDIIINDYNRLFIQKDGESLVFRSHSKFEEKYASLFDNDEHNSIIRTIEERCLVDGGLLSITYLYSYLRKKLPDSIKERYLCLSIDHIISNSSIMELFEDKASLIKSIVDKIIESNESFYNVTFVEKLIKLSNKDTVEKEFRRINKSDRIRLYIELQLNVISTEELKEYLLNNKSGIYHYTIKTPIDTQAIIEIISGYDCKTINGINNVVFWMNKYIGEEPSEYFEKVSWEKRKNEFINSICNLNNDYLKVITWALYFKSSGKISLLKDVFYMLSTDVQIRVLKRFFYSMAIGKLSFSLSTLQDILGSNIHKVSLPIEITLKYLSMKVENPNAQMTDTVMLSLLKGRKDHDDWVKINQMLTPCMGTISLSSDPELNDKNIFFSGTVEADTASCLHYEKFTVRLSPKLLTYSGEVTQYNNNRYNAIIDHIRISFSSSEYESYRDNGEYVFRFDSSAEMKLQIMAKAYRLRMWGVDYKVGLKTDEKGKRFCCEGRASLKPDEETRRAFLWCRNKPCFCKIPYYHSNYEWEQYTILDFMRILSIPTDYINKDGLKSEIGQYVILSSYMIKFNELFDHLKCRECGKLMEPKDLSNFFRSSVTEFSCINPECKEYHKIIYLNNCFNPRCKSIIDSRDSKTCPNRSYICTECGSCCSYAKYLDRYKNLQTTGGKIHPGLLYAIQNKIGHLEQGKRYCSSCGELMNESSCVCGKKYTISAQAYPLKKSVQS